MLHRPYRGLLSSHNSMLQKTTCSMMCCLHLVCMWHDAAIVTLTNQCPFKVLHYVKLLSQTDLEHTAVFSSVST